MSIRWTQDRRIKIVQVDAEAYNNVVDFVNEHSFKQSKFYFESLTPTGGSFYQFKRFYEKDDYSALNILICLWFCDNDLKLSPTGFPAIMYWYSSTNLNCPIYDYSKERISGQKSYSFINKLWNDEYIDSIPEVFSQQDKDYDFKRIKDCVPTPINYANPAYKLEELKVYKADVSSCYPSNLCGDLPTLKGAIYFGGYAEPTIDYPFAFYLKSHNIKIYNELDTSTWLYNKYYRSIIINNERCKMMPLDKDDEITLLMPKANAKFDNIISRAYEMRKTDKDVKIYMDACIGYFQKSGRPNLAHLSAVVIARANQFILNTCKELESKGNTILLINVDSIAWKGNKEDIATDDKHLGSFTYEYEGQEIDLIYKGSKSYQVRYWDRRDNDYKVVSKISRISLDDPRRDTFGSIIEMESEFKAKRIQYDVESNKIITF